MVAHPSTVVPGLCALAGLLAPPAAVAAPAELTGAWEVRADQGDTAIAARLEIAAADGGYTARSGPLDTLGIRPLQYRGEAKGGGLHLTALWNGTEVGALDLVPDGAGLEGRGRLFGTPGGVAGRRPATPPGAARTHDFDPVRHHVLSSSAPAPALRLFPGDTVRTRTADAAGVDERGVAAGMPGNPGTGPFYVEGAMPGDTVTVRIVRLATNRATAFMAGQIRPVALTPGYPQQPVAGRSDVWVVDAAKGEARPQAPSERLKDFAVPLQPMLGVVAVAPPAGLSVPNSDLGEWGGNLDYPGVKAGTTLHLPVYQAGALVFVGDGHARQGDGEIAGQGLETSLAVEFQVGLVKGRSLGQPWAEDSEFVMVSGIGGSLNDAFQRATAGLARWLKAVYQLDDNEVAAVMGTSVRYDVAEVVDPKFHIVAKLGKDVLARLGPPVAPWRGGD